MGVSLATRRQDLAQHALDRHPFHAHLAGVLGCPRCMETFWRAMERLRAQEPTR
jgi:hypothetical protein